MITHVITPINSRRDRSGNCYWAFHYLNTQTGKTVEGSISGGESNIRAVMLYLDSPDGNAVGWDKAKESVAMQQAQELPIREFDRRFKPSVCEYAGCLPEEIARFIRSRI